MVIARRDVPLTYIGDLEAGIQVSVMAGPEGSRRLGDDQSSQEVFTVDVSIELMMDEGNSAGNPIMRKICRRLCDWIFFEDGSTDRRKRRRLTSLDARPLEHKTVARHDPAELLANSIFLAMHRFKFEGVT